MVESKPRARALRVLVAALAGAPMALLTACGGGGGGDSPAAAAVQPVASAVVITTDNAKPVSADALANSTDTRAAQSGSSFVTGVQLGAGADANASVLLAQAARKLASLVPADRALATGVQATETMQCSMGGSATVTVNAATSTGLTAGDSISVSASGCKEMMNGMSETMSGQMTISIAAGSISSTVNSYPLHVVMRVDSSNFTMVQNGSTTVTSGDLTIDMTETSSTAATMVLSGSMLSNSVATATGTRSYTMRDYRQSLGVNGSAISYSVAGTVETSNPRLNATPVSYMVSTPATITTNASGDYTAGSLKVTGSNSALLLTVTGANAFQVQVDSNGDGTYESTTTSTMTELRSLL